MSVYVYVYVPVVCLFFSLALLWRLSWLHLQRLAHGCIPLFISDELNLYFYALTAHFWILAPGASERAGSASVAGGGWNDLWSSEENLPAAQAGSSQARDAPGDRGRSQGHLAGIRFLWTTEHRLH